MNCRHCSYKLNHLFLDLGFSPPSNAYIKENNLNSPETYFPLKVNVCNNCWLVQTEDYNKAEELFTDDYAYFSSVSNSWIAHAKHYADYISRKLNLTKDSQVIEIASNDGYLLKNFREKKIPCFGIEPTKETADVAKSKGIEVLNDFFSSRFAKQIILKKSKADLVIGNNVFAHVPDINDFTLGMKLILKTQGTITLEFPHLLNLIKHCQFDTIYHEHYSYLSLFTVNEIMKKYNLKVYDVEKLSTHGGSLRVYISHENSNHKISEHVPNFIQEEKLFGLQSLNTYKDFEKKVFSIKYDLLEFLLKMNKEGRSVVGYGAAAKGNTLLNYTGIKSDLIHYICDASKSKQNKYMPGSHIKIVSPEILNILPPDYIFILPWNLSAEIIEINRDLIKKGTKFFKAIPKLEFL